MAQGYNAVSGGCFPSLSTPTYMLPRMGRKLDVGDTLSQAFSIYGSQAGVLIPLALALYLVVAVVNGLLAATFLLLPLTFAVTIIIATLYQGTVVQLVRDVQDGRRDSSIGDLLSSVGPVLLPLIGAGLLAGIAIGIGFLLLIVPGLILLTLWAVIAPVIVVENPGVFAAFGRSRELVRGNGWQVFGVIVVVWLIVFVAGIILGAIGSALGDSAVIQIIFELIASSLTAPIAALVATVLYFRLRAIEDVGAAAPEGFTDAPAPGGPAPGGPAPGTQPGGAPHPSDPPPPPPPPGGGY